MTDSINVPEIKINYDCGSFKLCEKMIRDKNLPQCNQCVNLNCTIGVQNYVSICDLVEIKEKEGGGY